MRDDDAWILALAASAAILLVFYSSRAGASVLSSAGAGTGAGTGAAMGGATTGTGTGTFAATAPPYDPVGQLLGAIVPMTVSPAGIAFIKQQEGLTLTPMPDAGGAAIGYGHEIAAGSFAAGITLDQAEALLASDIATVESTINGAVTVPLSQQQFDALADFVYNVGSGAFLSSTLLRMLNAGDYAGAAAQFSRWVHSGNQVLPGLQSRRLAESQLFTSTAIG